MKPLLKKIKDIFYNILVRKVPQIKNQYEGYVDANKYNHQKHRLNSWMLLLKLNIAYHIFKISAEGNTVYGRKCPYCEGSESSISIKETPQEFATKLLEYDIISFDIFDTLIFRPFSCPSDLFHVVGERQHYLDFARIRAEMEHMARQEKFKKSGTYEITINDIYDRIEKYVGIEKQSGINLEVQTELELCYANPYMLEVYNLLKKHNKRIIIVSDMYLTKDIIKQLLNNCGYIGCEEFFISCEFDKSKHTGELYAAVKAQIGKELSYIHIGDNEHSDVINAQKHGLDAIHYPNVNETGMIYRADEMSKIIGSAYSGIVNASLHCGLEKYSLQYEYGFIYGGLFVLGYCNFIHQYTVQNKIEKVLFLARDGDILKQVYDKVYPNNNSEYVYWSRLAAAKLAANRYKYDYFRRFITHKIDSRITIQKVLQSMELEDFIPICGIEPDMLLTKDNAKQLKIFLLEKWDNVIAHYSNQVKAGKIYYSNVLQGYKNVCAVDIGWAGSGATILSYMVNEVWNIPCNITGIVAGTNGNSNAEPHASEALLKSKQLISYLYSQDYNRDLWKSHNPSAGHNIYFEMLLSSIHPSFKGFDLDGENAYRLMFNVREEENETAVNEIQKGILDFVDKYIHRFKQYPYMLNISGSDAYAPFKLATVNDSKYLKVVLGNCTFIPFVGDCHEKNKIVKDRL